MKGGEKRKMDFSCQTERELERKKVENLEERWKRNPKKSSYRKVREAVEGRGGTVEEEGKKEGEREREGGRGREGGRERGRGRERERERGVGGRGGGREREREGYEEGRSWEEK